MWFTDLIALAIVFALFTVAFVSVVTSITWLLTHTVNRWFAYLDRELQIRQTEAEMRLEEARAVRALPAWLDREDPREVHAWNAAVNETLQLVSRPLIGGSEA